MIMVSPEPNFWIHAVSVVANVPHTTKTLRRCILASPSPNLQCVELAKSPRVVQDKGKSRSKGKEKAKGTDKEKDKSKDVREGPVYDYEDGSVHDSALKEDIMRGYERFKVCVLLLRMLVCLSWLGPVDAWIIYWNTRCCWARSTRNTA